jgi:hypothetical protein
MENAISKYAGEFESFGETQIPAALFQFAKPNRKRGVLLGDLHLLINLGCCASDRCGVIYTCNYCNYCIAGVGPLSILTTTNHMRVPEPSPIPSVGLYCRRSLIKLLEAWKYFVVCLEGSFLANSQGLLTHINRHWPPRTS